ncbi:MAG: GMC family oxidoreductase [Gammaproteobacteria bacterium]
MLKQMVQKAKRGNWPDEFGEKLWRVITDLDSVAEGLYERARGRRYRPLGKEIILYVQSEQQPNPDSRISLSEQHDQLGLRKIKVDWRCTELDKRTIRVATQLIGEEFGRLGLGRIKLHDWLLADNAEWREDLWGFGHHMGTTRMVDDPNNGVVDKNCRVHTMENLYIAGSSVFPTGGYVNPTLTIVALALRLSDQLKAKLSV